MPAIIPKDWNPTRNRIIGGMTVKSSQSLGRLARLYQDSAIEEQKEVLAAVRSVPGGVVIADRLPAMSRNPQFLQRLGLHGRTSPPSTLDRGDGTDKGKGNFVPGLQK